MTRISTFNLYNANTAGLSNAQSNINQAVAQSTSERLATDLKGYGANSGRLVNTQAVLQKLEGRSTSLGILSARAEIEETAYSGFTDAVQEVREAISNAIATNNAAGLKEVIEGAYATAMEAANTKYAGQYIFGGVRSDTAPLNSATLDQMAAQPNTDSYWQDTGGSAKVAIDDNYEVNISKTAEDVFRPFMDFLKDIKQWENSNTAFSGKLDETQAAYLQSTLTNIKTIGDNAIDAQSQAGSIQKQIEDKYIANEDKKTSLNNVVAGIVKVDLAEVASRLSAAQLQYKAAAQIFAQTKDLNLLAYLD